MSTKRNWRMKKTDRIRLGITGGIGSGKSYICRILQERFGMPVYDCDRQARLLTLTQPEIQAQLETLIGGVCHEDGTIDKAVLARYLFASEENARRVNAIIHPAVRADLRNWYARQTVPVVAMESAILYESGFETEVDKVLFVDAPFELRLQRAMERDKASREDILQRMNRQQSESQRLRADFRITNDGSSNLEPLLADLLQAINPINRISNP